MAYNSAAYCSGVVGPGSIQNQIADIQGSGLTTVILWALHVGRTAIQGQQYGDLIFNDFPSGLLVSGGAFNPDNSAAVAAWPAQVAQLKQQGSVSKVFLSVGGAPPWVEDFATLAYMFANGMTGTVTANIAALKQAFTINGTCAIDGFDIDYEEATVSPDTIAQFCEILFAQGFEVTFCPYEDPPMWQACMQTLWNRGMKVSWWNLQCYSGGHSNRDLANLTPWITALASVVGQQAAPSCLVPGLAVAGANDTWDGQCPTGQDSICTTAATWAGLGLPSAFVWKYDSLVANPNLCGGNSLAAYVTAINDGLSNSCT